MNPLPKRVADLTDPKGRTVIKIMDDHHGFTYLTYFDPEYRDPEHNADVTGLFMSSPDPALALRFINPGMAAECWRMQSHTKPLRRDGKPNRPLSACTVSIETLGKEHE